MSIPATQMRPGMVIKHNNKLHTVFSVEHRTPGNLRAFIQAKLRNLRTGAMFEHRFRSPDPIEKIVVDEVDMEYLYSDGDDYYFMNTESYEQTHLKRDTLGDAVEYLTPNLQIKVEFYDGKPVGIELPQTVELTVVETEPGLKSATASSVTKPAKLETGLELCRLSHAAGGCTFQSRFGLDHRQLYSLRKFNAYRLAIVELDLDLQVRRQVLHGIPQSVALEMCLFVTFRIHKVVIVAITIEIFHVNF